MTTEVYETPCGVLINPDQVCFVEVCHDSNSAATVAGAKLVFHFPGEYRHVESFKDFATADKELLNYQEWIDECVTRELK